MTDDLKTLLRREAEDLRVPGTPVLEVLAGGRRVRRRRRTSGVLAASAVVVLTAAVVGVVRDRTGDSTLQPTELSHHLAANAGAISVGRTIYVDNERFHAPLPERSAGVFYTSAGVLARTSAHGTNRGPYHFMLVDPHGGTKPLGLTTGDGGIDSIPTQPYLVRTEVHAGTVDVVVDDVSTDREVARVALPGHPTWRKYLAAPPVSLDGDTAFVATAGTAYAVDWRTGEVTPNHVIGPDDGPVRGGRVVDPRGRVLDVSTGKILLRFGSPESMGVLSWDGRYLLDRSGALSSYVYDVATGRRVELRKMTGYSWTPDGHAFGTDVWDGPLLQVVVCSPDTGRCARHPIPTPKHHKFAFILGGQGFR
jgi:hypothetical protein